MTPTISGKVTIKKPDEIRIMKEGGMILAEVKRKLKSMIKPGENAVNIENKATEMIVGTGAKPSFKMVPGYKYTTCVNTNEGIVHGIPKKEIIFKKGDIVSVDLGVYFKGFHTDSSFSVGIEVDKQKERFLKAGKDAFEKARLACRPGNRIFDISKAIESTIRDAGYSPIESLVGHGIGRKLHEEPSIPCHTKRSQEKSLKILPGMTFAIEVMYTLGKPDLGIAEDGWTIVTLDGKISALFEDTVSVEKNGAVVITD